MTTRMKERLHMMNIMEQRKAAKLISMKFRGVTMECLKYSHTCELGMVFKTSTGRRFLYNNVKDIKEV